MNRGSVAGLALTFGMTAATVIGTAGAADAAVHDGTPPTVQVGWTDSATPKKAHPDNGDTHLPLGTWADEAGTTHTSRVYATFDLSAYEGKKVYGGSVTVVEQSAADCTKRSIELWRTKAVSAAPTWKNAPAEMAELDEIQTPEYCPKATITFDVGAALIAAVAEKQRLVTFELRVSAEHEADPAYGRRLSAYRGVRISAEYDTAPTIDRTRLYNGGVGCTQLKPYPKLGGLAGELQALVADADEADANRLTTEFAVWRVGAPETRTVYTQQDSRAGRVARFRVPDTALVSGTSYGWQARVSDGAETSAWSKKCFFTYDGVAPSAPVVTSPNFPEGTRGPVGELPRFVLDGHGDKDVAGFTYSWWDLGVPTCETGEYGQLVCPDPFSRSNTVKAGSPGGTATVTLNPDDEGPKRLAVRALDAAGNQSATVYYTIFAPVTAPTVEVEGPSPVWNGEVLLRITPASGISDVTEFEIERAGQGYTETREPDENGVGWYSFTAYELTGPAITVRSRSSSGFVSAPTVWRAQFNQEPGVIADVYRSSGEAAGGVGVEGRFTFTPPPGWTDVAEYRYTFDDDWTPDTDVAAGEDGRATITWTPESSGAKTLVVVALRADGTESAYPAYHFFEVA